MQDKPIHQQRLARDLASLVEALQSEVVLPFLEAFWKTMAREWNEIGSLRMDKFLFLVRQYVNSSFKYLSRRDWKNQDGIEEYARIIEEVPLNPTDMKIPNGLRYHILDIYVDELEKVAGEKIDADVLEKLMEPVRKLSKESKVKSVRNAAKEVLNDDRLKVWRGEKVGNGEDDEMKEGEDDEWGGIED
jgi:ribosomal RNA-processing protein 1